MTRQRRQFTHFTRGMLAAGLFAFAPTPAGSTEAPSPLITCQARSIRTLDDLAGLTAPELDQLYRQSGPGLVPVGKVRGLALYPDANHPRFRSRAARIAWQGKVFQPESGTAVNRFFGLRAIKGNVYAGSSWLDGGPAMILDYQDTSILYGNYRDEIRQVATGLYLGLMYARTEPRPTFKMYFAFEFKP